MGVRPRFVLALLFFLVALAAGIAILSDASPLWLPSPPCPFHEMTGLYCPGCGSTRAIRRILRCDLVGAFRCNPFLVLLAPFFFWQLVLWFYDLARDERPFRQSSYWFAIVVVATALVFTVARNIPLESLEWLRPPT